MIFSEDNNMPIVLLMYSWVV